MGKVFFFNADIKAKVSDKTSIKKLIGLLFKNEKASFDRVNYIFCSDKYLLEINREFLEHDTLTDIITFPLSTSGLPISAEIYVSIKRVQENAKLFNVSYENELLRVIIHGALHLCGYNDKKKVDKLHMRNKEDFYIKNFKRFT